MANAHRAVWPPGGLELHSCRGLVALDADCVKNVDGRAVARMANSIAAIIGAHQPDAGLVIGRKGGGGLHSRGYASHALSERFSQRC